MAAPGGRTRPLRCFSIRVLSSASWSLSDVDCIASGIGRVENLVRKSATFYTKFIKLNKRGKKRPKFTPFVCLRSLWSKEPGRQVPIERHGRPRPCEGTHAVGRMSEANLSTTPDAPAPPLYTSRHPEISRLSTSSSGGKLLSVSHFSYLRASCDPQSISCLIC